MGLHKNIPIILGYGKSNQVFHSPLKCHHFMHFTKNSLIMLDRPGETPVSVGCMRSPIRKLKSLTLFFKKAKSLGALLLAQSLMATHLISLTNWSGLFLNSFLAAVCTAFSSHALLKIRFTHEEKAHNNNKDISNHLRNINDFCQ